MAEGEKEPEQKLVIDEDWKAQVEKEKAAARARQGQQQAGGSAPSPSAEGEGGAAAAPRETAAAPSASGSARPQGADRSAAGKEKAAGPAAPPASFPVLVSMLFTQAMAAMGQIPDPASGKPQVDRAFAKHYIDTLAMLEEKTQGNLSSEEASMLSEALHALRMTFVSTKPS